jgi:integrase
MQKFLTAYEIEFAAGTNWFYKPPSLPPPKQRHIYLPDEMYDILHYKYTKDKLKDAFIQYSLTFSTIFGWRNPSELCSQKISDIDIDNRLITITEKKKHNKKRIISPKYEEIFDCKQIKSLKNWIDVWRPKLQKNNKFNDFLFVRLTDGTPITEMQYTKFINYYVRPVFPKFKLYSTRHFCARGILIREYIKTKHWYKSKVQTYLGHEKIDTTTNYTIEAEQLLKVAPYDWFKRILRQPNKKLEENTLKSTNKQKTFLSDGTSSECSEISEQKQTVFK